MYLRDVLKLFAVNVATSTETRWANVRYPALVAMRTYKRESAYKKLVEDLRFNEFLTKTQPYEFVNLLRRFNLRLTNKSCFRHTVSKIIRMVNTFVLYM